jgi:hypothetical protein
VGKKSGSGSGMNSPDHIYECLDTIFPVKILKFFDADPGSGMEKIRSGIRDKHTGSATLILNSLMRIRDPGWKKFDPGSGINIPDPQH